MKKITILLFALLSISAYSQKATPCDKLESYSGDTATYYFSPVTDGISIIMSVGKNKPGTTFSIDAAIKSDGKVHANEKGLTLILANGEQIAIPDAKIEFANGQYTTQANLEYDHGVLLIANKITAVMIGSLKQEVKQGEVILAYYKCLLTM